MKKICLLILSTFLIFNAGTARAGKFILKGAADASAPASLEVSTEKLTVLKGKTGTLTATVKDYQGKPVTNAVVKGKIKKGRKKINLTEKKVKTNQKGIAAFEIEGKKKGNAKIKLKVKGTKISKKVKVKVKP